nr:unnamed protein product [Callosobruchus chinensis]
MPTRNQIEFETSLIKALRSNNIANAVTEKFNCYDAEIASLEAEMQLLKSSCNNTTSSRDDSSKIERKVDVLQQEAKNNKIRLMGAKESPNKNILVAVKQVIFNKLKINPEKLDNNVTIGSNTLSMLKKKMLKGSQIVMKEDLTVERTKFVNEASEKYGFKNVCTFNGNIFVKTDNGLKKYLYNMTDH